MTLLELLNLANEAYPDGYLSQYYHDPKEWPEVEAFDPNDWEQVFNPAGQGDTLAECIVIELCDAFRDTDPGEFHDDELLANAIGKMERLEVQLARVKLHFVARRLWR